MGEGEGGKMVDGERGRKRFKGRGKIEGGVRDLDGEGEVGG